MAATILDNQLKLIIIDDAAKPDVFINPVGNVIVHLTQGFNSATFPLGQGNALTAGAHVPLSGGLGGSTFGFVQIGRSNFYGAFYSGRIANEGSVGVLGHVPPAMANPVMLDASGDAPIPFFQDPARSSFTAPTVNSTWGDHPASRVPTKLNNSNAHNIPNYLFHLIDDREFWTIFTAQDPGGALRFIAHFRWQVRYDVEFMWRAGDVQVRTSKSFFKVHERNTKGRPADASIQAMLSNPVGPLANVAFLAAINLAFKGPRGSNRSENPKQFTNVPPDFWG